MPEEHEYVQCLADPRPDRRNRFITVRNLRGVYMVDNSVCDPIGNEQNVKEDQDGAAEYVKHSSCNDIAEDFFQQKCQHMSHEKLRLLEPYGVKGRAADSHLQEVEPDAGRNAQNISLISYWEYSEDKGVFCIHSFFASRRYTKI